MGVDLSGKPSVSIRAFRDNVARISNLLRSPHLAVKEAKLLAVTRKIDFWKNLAGT